MDSDGARDAAAVSVVMPTFEQAAFLPRAVGSLLRQTTPDWELVVVDDGSRDATAAAVRPFLDDPRVTYRRLSTNHGLGAALNRGIAAATAPLIAYLPSDDVYDPDHLAALLGALGGAVLAWSGMRHHGGQAALAPLEGYGLQLVQVLHRRTPDAWVERGEVETDDLDRLMWDKLRERGRFVATGRVTCAWTDHPGQRHKAIRESHDGGLNVFRRRYRVAAPLRFRSTDSWPVDEPALYHRFRARPPTPPSLDGLKVLFVGELAFNPERILALEERGHRLYGLWTPDGLGDSTVGPLPFGHVTDLPRQGWRDAVRRLRPDVVYALLNWRAVGFAHAVLDAGLGIPFVWHFKESPQRAIVRGDWPLLADLVTRSDAQVFSSAEELAWFELALPGRVDPARTLVLDGDLPKRDWFDAAAPRPRLSETDGEVHTAVVGRPLGLDAALLRRLAAAGVHVHLHGLVSGRGPGGAWRGWIDEAVRGAEGYVHLHPHVGQDGWVEVLSRYDAGWLHRVASHNGGDLGAATWDDLNLPARIPPLLAAGVPLLQQRSPGCRVAAQRLVGTEEIGVLYDDVDDLCAALHDHDAMAGLRRNVAARREEFTFDHHADRLVGLFREVAG